jgi:uncharacterized protein (TIGR03435 family)
MATSQFDIMATTGMDVSDATFAEQLPALLRSLLEDRFKLKTHTERRPFPVYALVKARNDGRLGPQLRFQSVTDCQAVTQAVAAAAPPRTMPSPSTGRPTCSLRGGRGTLIAGSITMGRLAGFFGVAGALDRIVLDRTDLVGVFDVDLQWSPESMRMALSANALSDVTSLSDGPSLFRAVQEQLGLKLEPRDEPMEAVIVDHIERPTPN